MLKLHSVFFDDMNPAWRIEESPAAHDILLLVVHGSCTYVLNGKPIPLEKGDCLFVPYGTLRAGINGSDGPHQKYSVHFRIDDPAQFPLSDASAHLRTRTRSFEFMKQRFAALAHQWFGRMPYFETICLGITLELLGHMARESEMKRFPSSKLHLVKEVQDYIIAHYREPVRIDDLAQKLDRTPNYITQIYKEVTGFTPIAYLHHLRIQAARELIVSDQKSIHEVSDYLGFSDPSHFNRVFKKIMSYPPSALLHERRATRRLEDEQP